MTCQVNGNFRQIIVRQPQVVQDYYYFFFNSRCLLQNQLNWLVKNSDPMAYLVFNAESHLVSSNGHNSFFFENVA